MDESSYDDEVKQWRVISFAQGCSYQSELDDTRWSTPIYISAQTAKLLL